MSNKIARRRFVKAGLVAASATAVYPRDAYTSTRILGANDRINVGMIGVGGRGSDLIRWVLDVGKTTRPAQIVAVCDVYRKRANRAKEVSGAETATLDYRE